MEFVMTDLRKKHIAEFAGGFPLCCIIFVCHGVAVYIFHDMICFPPAHLQDVFLWDVEGRHFTGEVVTELVYRSEERRVWKNAAFLIFSVWRLESP